MFMIVRRIRSDSPKTNQTGRPEQRCLRFVAERGPPRRPCLPWIAGAVRCRFQPYLVAIMQVLCKLRALYAKNKYGLQGLAFMVGEGNDNK